MNIQPLIDRWQTDKGKPYNGTLIDMDAYNADPSDPGCMCAQGQVLHYAGWDAFGLDNFPQHEADSEVARLLNISISHAILLRIVNDRADGAPAVVLTDPGAVLGDHWSKVLDFWWYLDSVTGAEWEVAGEDAWEVAQAAALEVALEFLGTEIMRRDGKSFRLWPIFGFASPDDIPARPANYGPFTSSDGAA